MPQVSLLVEYTDITARPKFLLMSGKCTCAILPAGATTYEEDWPLRGANGFAEPPPLNSGRTLNPDVGAEHACLTLIYWITLLKEFRFFLRW